MYYYFVDNRVISQVNEMDRSCNDNDELNETQLAFYLANPTATANEVVKLAMDVITPTLQDAKNSKLSELENAYLAWRNTGWTDSISGYTLFLGEKDQLNYTQLKSIIFDEPNGTMCDVGTTTGWQQVEKTVLYNMLVRYGKDALAAYKHKSNLEIYINFVAQTIEEVEAVTWD